MLYITNKAPSFVKILMIFKFERMGIAIFCFSSFLALMMYILMNFQPFRLIEEQCYSNTKFHGEGVLLNFGHNWCTTIQKDLLSTARLMIIYVNF